jgi:hypothetical protein
MNYRYTLLKLRQLLGKNETLAATGRDALATMRVKELRNAIAVLHLIGTDMKRLRSVKISGQKHNKGKQ